MSDRAFELICEIEPPTRPDLTRVRHQIGVMSPDRRLVPDPGQPHRAGDGVQRRGRARGAGHGRPQHRLPELAGPQHAGLQRDLLTAAAYGVRRSCSSTATSRQSGGRTSELTVRAMIERDAGGVGGSGVSPERGRSRSASPPGCGRYRSGSAPPTSCSPRSASRWRPCCGGANASLDIPVYAGVMVLASAGMAPDWRPPIPDIDIPASLVDRRRARSRRRGGRGVRAGAGDPRLRRLRRGRTWCRSAGIGRSRPAWKACSERGAQFADVTSKRTAGSAVSRTCGYGRWRPASPRRAPPQRRPTVGRVSCWPSATASIMVRGGRSFWRNFHGGAALREGRSARANRKLARHAPHRL